MSIYLKITVALAISALLIESNALLARDGFGRFVMAFVYAGFLLAGVFFIVSAAERFVRRQTLEDRRNEFRMRKAHSSDFAVQSETIYHEIKTVQ